MSEMFGRKAIYLGRKLSPPFGMRRDFADQLRAVRADGVMPHGGELDTAAQPPERELSAEAPPIGTVAMAASLNNEALADLSKRELEDLGAAALTGARA